MKIINCIQAREAITHLMEKSIVNFKKARELVKMRKLIESEIEFYTEQEKKAVKTYAEVDENGNPIFVGEGRIKLRGGRAKQEFDKTIQAILDTNIDEVAPVTLNEEDFANKDYPTPNDIYLLDGFVIFE